MNEQINNWNMVCCSFCITVHFSSSPYYISKSFPCVRMDKRKKHTVNGHEVWMVTSHLNISLEKLFLCSGNMHFWIVTAVSVSGYCFQSRLFFLKLFGKSLPALWVWTSLIQHSFRGQKDTHGWHDFFQNILKQGPSSCWIGLTWEIWLLNRLSLEYIYIYIYIRMH